MSPIKFVLCSLIAVWLTVNLCSVGTEAKPGFSTSSSNSHKQPARRYSFFTRNRVSTPTKSPDWKRLISIARRLNALRNFWNSLGPITSASASPSTAAAAAVSSVIRNKNKPSIASNQKRPTSLANALSLRRRWSRPSRSAIEGRQLGLIRTLFRYPLLLVFSNLFSLPLLPMLLIASPVLNSLPNTPSSSLAGSGGFPFGGSSSGSSFPLTMAQINQLLSVNSTGFLGNFVSDIISDLQAGSSVVNDFLQNLGNSIGKPNRVSSPGNFANNPDLDPSRRPLTPASFAGSSLNATLSKYVNGTEVVIANLSSPDSNSYSIESSSDNFALPSSPSSSSGSSSASSASVVSSSLLNQLANSLVESSKNHHITGK